MCLDISYTAKLKELLKYFPDVTLSPHLEFYVHQGVHIMADQYGLHPILYGSRNEGLNCRYMEWGCIPFYVKDEKSFLPQRSTMLNARSEHILDDIRSFWYKIKDRRCAIPVNGIYEHRAIDGWDEKVPYYVKLKEQEQFFLPGLYSTVELPNMETGKMIRRYTFTLITRAANSVMHAVHNDGENKHRMPLFLPFEFSEKWLESNISTNEYRSILNYVMPSESLDYWPVYTIRSARPRPDDKLKNEPWTWEKLPELL